MDKEWLQGPIWVKGDAKDYTINQARPVCAAPEGFGEDC